MKLQEIITHYKLPAAQLEVKCYRKLPHYLAALSCDVATRAEVYQLTTIPVVHHQIGRDGVLYVSREVYELLTKAALQQAGGHSIRLEI